MKKISNKEALANIKVIISTFYEDNGRSIIDDVQIAQATLIQKIEDYLNKTEIPSTFTIPLKLKLDSLSEREKEAFWNGL